MVLPESNKYVAGYENFTTTDDHNDVQVLPVMHVWQLVPYILVRLARFAEPA
jgi:hypothetical protein